MIISLMFLILVLLAFSSVISGVFLSYFVKEELNSGAKYFKMFQDALIFISLIVFLYFNPYTLFLVLMPILFVALRYINQYQYNLYFGMSVLLYFSFRFNGFAYLWSIVFVYGFFMSSYLCSQYQKLTKKEILLFLIKRNKYYLISSVVGALLLFLF